MVSLTELLADGYVLGHTSGNRHWQKVNPLKALIHFHLQRMLFCLVPATRLRRPEVFLISFGVITTRDANV